jgi:hypothetical protein
VLDRDHLRRAIAVLLGIAIFAFGQGTASAGTLADYERVSERIWSHAPVVRYVWTRTEAELDRYCDPERTLPAGRVAGCADLGGPRMILSWPHWRGMHRVERCELHSHEWGHLLGWTHDDQLFEAMERKSRRLCRRRFLRKGWFVSRSARSRAARSRPL